MDAHAPWRAERDGAALAERKRFRGGSLGMGARASASWRRRRPVCLSAEAKMRQAFHTIRVSTYGPGLYEVTGKLAEFVQAEKIGDGLLTCYIRHTSASLLIQENADPDVLKDLKDFFGQLAKKGMDYRHTAEGPDD